MDGSYVYKKSLWEKIKFNNSMTFGEDLNWVTKVIQVLFAFMYACAYVCMHVIK